jgi:glycosyltransferase involved in cell wall biosynthesis
MKVVHTCIRYDAPGGAETHVHAVTERLADRGHDVTVHASPLESEVPWREMENPTWHRKGVDVVRHDVHRNLLPGHRYPVMPDLPGALLDEGADVLHAHSHRYHQVGAACMVARATDTPLVVTPHYHPVRSDRPLWMRAVAWLLDRRARRSTYATADHVLPVTGAEADALRGIVDPGKMTVVPNGIDPDEWRPLPEPAEEAWEEPVWCFAGRQAPNKGLETLVDAFAASTKRRGTGTLVVTGRDWGTRDAMLGRARDRGVADRLGVLGYVDRERYRRVLARADVLVLPSEWEAFGIVVLEAWMAGTPVVATDVGGLPWVVEEGEDGLLVPPGDADALATAVEELLDRPDGGQPLARRGRRKTRNRFTWERSVDRIEDVYEDAAAR